MIEVHQHIIGGTNHHPLLLGIHVERTVHPRPVLLFAHGFNGFKDWGAFNQLAGEFATKHFAFVKFNFSHNGTTPAHPTEFVDLEAFGNNNYSKELSDLGLVTDWICSSDNPYRAYFDVDNLFLMGHSMGGGISILYACGDRRVKALITLAAIAECTTPWGNWPPEKMAEWKEQGVAYNLNGRTKQQMPLYYQLFEDYQQNSDRLNIPASMAELTIPVLICHGTLDEAVSVEKATALHKALPSAEIFLQKTDHVFGQQHPWTKETLPSPLQRVFDEAVRFLNKALEL